MQCFIAYDNNKQGVRPVILIVPEWWGLNEYPKSRAKQLAEMGYFAVAVDLYGNGSVAANPDEAKRMAGGFYANPQLAASRLQAALAKAKTYAQADSTKTAAIGYCFGGSVVLNAAKLGAPFAGVVSFHGALAGVTPSKNTIKSEILVCHGAADKFISPQEVTTFKKQLDSVGAKYTFKEYPNATHAFTNPAATETGKKFNMPISYNPEADKNSWNDMKTFFERIFK
jgi:dienelactone hydrolase